MPSKPLALRTAEPVQQQVIADRVFEAVREAILSLELPPDTHLTEAFLAQQFGVSATPVRETLQRLVHAGLVIKQTARGVKVRRLAEREVRDIYELRLQLEPLALRQSVPNLTPADLRALDRTLAQAKRATDQGDHRGASRLNAQFHSLLVARADNRLLLSWLESLGDLRRMIAMREWTDQDRSQVEFEEHRAILDRAAARDSDGAVELLARHIRHFL